MMEQGARYRAVWQTWTFQAAGARAGARPAAAEAGAAAGGGAAADAAPPPAAACSSLRAPGVADEWRGRMQTARVERRLSIADLAARVHVDVARLAGLERGDEVVDAETRARIERALGLAPPP